MKTEFLKAKAILPALFIVFCMTGIAQNVQKAVESKPVPGKAAVSSTTVPVYKIGSKPVEIFYESSGLMADFTISRQKTGNLNVEGTTGVSGLTSSNSSLEGRKENTIPVSPGQDTGNTFNLAGEPVPGAEIYIELEPDNNAKKIPVSSTNPFSRKVTLTPGTVNQGKVSISVKLSEKSFPWFIENGKRMISSGIYVFCLETTINKVKNANEFAVVINESVMSFQVDGSGPFSQSLSNIEDGRLVNPGNPREVEIDVKVYLVNSFTNMKKQ